MSGCGPSDSPKIDEINSRSCIQKNIGVGGHSGQALSDGSDMRFYVDLHAVACVVKTRKAIARPSGPGNPARNPAQAKAEQ